MVGGGLQDFSVIPRPLGFGFLGLGLRGLGPGLDNIFSPYRYSRPIKDGWPGRQKGRSKGMHVTGWCDQIN